MKNGITYIRCSHSRCFFLNNSQQGIKTFTKLKEVQCKDHTRSHQEYKLANTIKEVVPVRHTVLNANKAKPYPKFCKFKVCMWEKGIFEIHMPLSLLERKRQIDKQISIVCSFFDSIEVEMCRK